MIMAKQYRRLMAMAFLLLTALCALGFRLVDLQIWRHEEFRDEVEEKTHVTFVRQPRRGDIRDVKGNILAKSFPVKTVCADPQFIADFHPAVAKLLAPLLEMPAAELDELLQRRTTTPDGRSVPKRYVELKQKVPKERWEQIRQAMLDFPVQADEKRLPQAQQRALKALREKSIYARDDQLRVYPNQNLAAHVLGYVSTREGEAGAGILREMFGCDGIERMANGGLSGIAGWRSTSVVLNRELVSERQQDVQAQAGLNVYLTIDAGVQNIVEEELAQAIATYQPISASALVIRPKTGAIVAMANWPTFDPAHAGASPMDALRNRAISDTAEPGSTFKIVVVSAALNEKVVTLDQVFDCRSPFYYAGLWLHDHKHYENLTVEQIITKSSNIGAAKIGLQLGSERLHNYIRRFGFGTETGIPLLGEVNGVVHPLKKWSRASITHIPMGHEVAVTPLQMTFAMCAIANGGRLMRPLLIDRFEDENGQVVMKYQPQEVRQAISPEAARQTVQALKTVVSSDGTAAEAKLDHYTVAGKTGTAQKATKTGYSKDKYFSSFIGFFPADNPDLCISVVLNEPAVKEHVGGKTAAPVFRQIAERSARYLAIQTDLTPAAETIRASTATTPAALASSEKKPRL